LDPEQRNDYEKYKADNQQLLGEIQQSRQELEDINGKLTHAEGVLRQDTLKQRAQHLRDEKTHLLKRKEDLELQTNEMNLPFPEARERLMNRIKQDNAEIKQQEKEISEMRKIVDQYQRQLKEIQNELSGKPNEGAQEEAAKFEVLAQKEKEIQEFHSKFDSDKLKYETQIHENQQVIAALLEHMQKNLQRQNRLPGKESVDEMRNDLKFKQRQLNDAEMTAAKLQIEVEARTADLDKIKNLEVRIDKEMETVAEGINNMEDAMANKFAKIDDLTNEFEHEKQRLYLIKDLVEKYKSKLA
jgi:intraflagellar transport protein 74